MTAIALIRALQISARFLLIDVGLYPAFSNDDVDELARANSLPYYTPNVRCRPRHGSLRGSSGGPYLSISVPPCVTFADQEKGVDMEAWVVVAVVVGVAWVRPLLQPVALQRLHAFQSAPAVAAPFPPHPPSPLPLAPPTHTHSTHLPSQVLAVGFRLPTRWQMRHIPLARPLPFFLGHLLTYTWRPMYLCHLEWMQRHRGIALTLLGKTPVVVLAGAAAVGTCVRAGCAADRAPLSPPPPLTHRSSLVAHRALPRRPGAHPPGVRQTFFKVSRPCDTDTSSKAQVLRQAPCLLCRLRRPCLPVLPTPQPPTPTRLPACSLNPAARAAETNVAGQSALACCLPAVASGAACEQPCPRSSTPPPCTATCRL